ncbi:MAG TPA: phage holin family protein [Candidatus Acidoferrales bacterium]|nr:phage holin family protein [Candidatus Acidoferrales bacterium]
MPEARESPSDAIARLARDLTDLVRAELAVFKGDLAAQLRPAIAAGVLGIVAAAMALATLGAFTAFLIVAIAAAVGPWFATAIVTVVYAIVTAVLTAIAVARVRASVPIEMDRPIAAMKEDVAWIASDLKNAAK